MAGRPCDGLSLHAVNGVSTRRLDWETQTMVVDRNREACQTASLGQHLTWYCLLGWAVAAIVAPSRARNLHRMALSGAFLLLITLSLLLAPHARAQTSALVLGVQWLQAQVATDGRISNAGLIAQTEQIRCETAITLQQLSPSSSQFAALIAQPLTSSPASLPTETIACQQRLQWLLTPAATDTAELMTRYRDAGGAGSYSAYPSDSQANVLDSAWAYRAQWPSNHPPAKPGAFNL